MSKNLHWMEQFKYRRLQKEILRNIKDLRRMVDGKRGWGDKHRGQSEGQTWDVSSAGWLFISILFKRQDTPFDVNRVQRRCG